MPELQDDGPSLDAVAGRLEPRWLVHWLLDPPSLRNHTRMPRVLRGDDAARQRAAQDITAWLLQRGEPAGAREEGHAPLVPAAGDGSSAGERLFENLGCIGCHHLQPPDFDDWFERTSLHWVAEKFRPRALVPYLRAPHAQYGASRMPDFGLTETEANRLASYLRSRLTARLPEIADHGAGDPQRGARLAREYGCLNCHRRQDESPAVVSRPLEEPGRGCLADGPPDSGTAPDFGWEPDERAALIDFLAADRVGASLGRFSAVEAAERFINQRRCAVCHARDDGAALWPEVLAEEGSQGLPPAVLPSLTWAGEKLRVPWMQKLFMADLDYKPRPWLQGRMPQFARHAGILARGLAAQHGYSQQGPPSLPADRQQVDIGYRLTQRDSGFFCIECHAVGDQPAVGAFAHHGVNFAHVAERLHFPYYRRWITDPLRVDRDSKMPKFSADGVTSPKTDFYEGDAQRQFEALWQYLQSLSGAAGR
jgi:cytochrome c551/c552